MKEIENTRNAWDAHYRRERSVQEYPDENLVRILKKLPLGPALDLGCGSGRHLKLLRDLGYDPVYGADLSSESIRICRERQPYAFLFGPSEIFPRPDHFRLPLPDATVELVILWGVLHYNTDEVATAMLEEASRVLAPGGVMTGTLRSSNDTHFKENQDINHSHMQYFTESQARDLLSLYLTDIKIGYIERCPPEEPERRIAHWVFYGTNKAAARS